MEQATSFGPWLKQRRKALDLTQAELAAAVGCATMTIQKIEADERRPSKQIAERLAQVVATDVDEHAVVVRWARGSTPPATLPGQPPVPIAVADRAAAAHNLPLELTSFIGRA